MKDGMVQLEAGTVTQPRTLFKPGSWLAKIDFINHLILFNNVLITVLSEQKGGKTSFSTLLQNNLDQQIKSVSMTVKAPCSREQIIIDIATQLHLNNDTQTDLLSIVDQINERKAHVLLVIDDAQHLPESLIKEAMIAIKNQGDFGFFHLCLVSDYSVVATLNSLAVDHFNNLIHTIELGLLNESETRTYVLQRAMAAGLITRPLSEEQYKRFFQFTKGNLAKINSSLESFIFNFSAPKIKTKSQILMRAGAAIAASVIAGVSYLYLNDTFTSHSSQIADELSKQPISQIASWQDSSIRQLVRFELPKKQVLDDINENQLTNTVALVDKVVVIPSVRHRALDTVALKEEPKIPVHLKAAEPIVTHSALATAANGGVKLESTLVTIGALNPLKVATQKVLKQGANQYTIQLVASHNQVDIHRFKNKNKFLAETQMRHFTNQKGSWYILTLGHFNSISEAQAHASHLPKELSKLNPWVRPVSGLNNIG